MGILSGPEILRQWEAGKIVVDPFSEANINPASYDLRLGGSVVTYEIGPNWDPAAIIDVKREVPPVRVKEMGDDGFVIWPGCLYLMHTLERIHTTDYVPVIDGKSSIGRLGVFIHVTAGYGDPGFDGQYTLEVATVRHPVRLYPGMKIAQVRFHELVGPHLDYRETGSYTGTKSMGPVPSQVHRQFIRKEVPPIYQVSVGHGQWVTVDEVSVNSDGTISYRGAVGMLRSAPGGWRTSAFADTSILKSRERALLATANALATSRGLRFGWIPISELEDQPRMVRDVDGDWVCECGTLVGAGMEGCMCGRAAPAKKETT